MMNLHSKKKVALILLIIITFSTILIIKKTFLNGYGDDYFVQYTSFVAMPQNSIYNLDLIYFIKKGDKDILIKKNIINVVFANSKLTKIANIDFSEESRFKKYKSKTLSLVVSFPHTGVETVDHIEITFIDGTKKVYPIGNWQFIVSDISEGEYIETASGLPGACSNTDGYFMRFKNNSDKTLIVSKLILDCPNITNNFNEFPVSGNEQIDKRFILKFVKGNRNVHNIYFLKPRIEYLLDNKTYAYYPFGTYYGVMNLNNKAIEQEIAKSKLSK